MERVIVVNEQDEEVGVKIRGEFAPDDIGRSSALWVTDEDGNILLVRRGYEVKWYPGLLSYAVTGAVSEGESYEQAVLREMQEELGIVGFAPAKAFKYLVTLPHFSWFMQVFTLTLPHDYAFVLDPKEVAELKWFTRDELVACVAAHPEEFVRGFADETKSLFTR